MVYAHYKNHGRSFPWRRTTNPYRILVSEIMLQQTQTDRVVPKYKEFIKTFPSFQTLAKAPLRDVLQVWQGLGYNRRAKMLKCTAEIVVKEYKGTLPKGEEELVKLPGIGKYTAGAIVVFAFNKPAVFIETNIRSVFIHFFFGNMTKVSPVRSKSPKATVDVQARRISNGVKDSELLPLIEKTLDRKNPREWYAALMDYGAMLKKEHLNPSQRSAHYTKQSKFEGSDRQIRGRIIKALVEKKKLTREQIIKEVNKESKRVRDQLKKLKQEGFIIKQEKFFRLH